MIKFLRTFNKTFKYFFTREKIQDKITVYLLLFTFYQKTW